MSPSNVDSRIVDLGFNNKQFESGTKESLKSLETLKQSLNFDETSQSLKGLDAAGKKFSLKGIASGVEQISSRFSALGAVGFAVIQRLTNSAIDFGKKMMSQLTEPMRTGFEEYETQMNAIQTVLANTESKGTTLEDVSAALNELNTYADKTIYNFTEMTRNIGTFTAAGVDLDTSTAAIKGIANLAAVSGSNSQQASTAMYQLSQALSSGTVKLMDWNSVVNAGMGGQVFQDALMETARVHGIAIDDMIEQRGSFRETLQEGWLSSEVLLETLSKFTGDLSREQLLSMGYAEDQIDGILRLGQTANDAATKVKTLTQLQDTLKEAMQSGWTKTWELIVGDFEESKELFTYISDTFGAMIGESADARNSMLEDWKRFAGREALVQSLKNTIEGLMSIMTPVREAFREIFPPMTGMQLASLTIKFMKLTERLKISGETSDKIKRIFTGIFSLFKVGAKIVGVIATAFLNFGKWISGTIKITRALSGKEGLGFLDWLANIGDKLAGLDEAIDWEAFANGLRDALAQVFTHLTMFYEHVKKAFNFLKENIPPAVENIKQFGQSVKEEFSKAKEYIEGMIDPSVLQTITNFAAELKEKFLGLFNKTDVQKTGDFFKKIGDTLVQVAGILAKIGGAIIAGLINIGTTLGPVLKKAGGAIWDFVTNLFSGIGDMFKNADYEKIGEGIKLGLVGAIIWSIKGFIDSASGIFEGVADILEGVGDALQSWQMNLKAKTLLMIAAAIGILALSLIALSMVEAEKLAISLGIITGLFADLTLAMAGINKSGGGGAMASLQLIAMAIGITFLAIAMKKISEINPSALTQGILGIYLLTGALVAFTATMSKIKGKLAQSALGLLVFAGSLLALTGILQLIGNMDPVVLAQGLLGMGIILAELGAFLKLSDIDKMSATKGLGMLAMAGGILKLAKAVDMFGEMDTIDLIQGMIAIGLVLGELAIFAKLTAAQGPGFIQSAVAMMVMAYAMTVLSDVILELGSSDPMEVGQGLIAMGAALAVIALGLNAMTGTLPGSAALLIAAAALTIMLPVLQALGQMSLQEIGTALLALAGVFLVFGLAALLLAPVTPIIVVLAVALMALGAGLYLAGAGALAFSAAMAALAITGVAGATAIVAMVTILLTLIPIIIAALIGGLILFAQGIITATPMIGKALWALITMVLDLIAKAIPKLMKILTILLDALINLIVIKIPEFVEAVLSLLLQMLEKIVEYLPDFIQAGFDILISFLQGIRDNIADVVTVVSEIVVEFLGAVADNLPDIIQAGMDLIIAFIDGMAEAIDNNMQPLLDALGRLATAMIDGLVRGISAGYEAVKEALSGIINKAIDAIKKMLGIKSPSKVFADIASNIPEGMAVGIKKTASAVYKATEDLAKTTVDGFSGINAAIEDLMNVDENIEPVIRPIVDMTNIEDSQGIIDDVFNRSIALGTSIAKSQSVATGGLTVDKDGTIVNEGTNIKLVQNNYSPKALSRKELYRQTKNLMIPLKGLVKS